MAPRLTRRSLLLLPAAAAMPLSLGGCINTGEWAPDDVVARALLREDGPYTITLNTVAQNRSGTGDHSSLVINGDTRILYDPAGSWRNRHAPQRNDVHYGMSRQMERVYVAHHARRTHHVVQQTVEVSRAQANAAIAAAEAAGVANDGQCTTRTSSVLRATPGFEDVPFSFFPRSLMNAFGRRPGVAEVRWFSETAEPEGARERFGGVLI